MITTEIYIEEQIQKVDAYEKEFEKVFPCFKVLAAHDIEVNRKRLWVVRYATLYSLDMPMDTVEEGAVMFAYWLEMPMFVNDNQRIYGRMGFKGYCENITFWANLGRGYWEFELILTQLPDMEHE